MSSREVRAHTTMGTRIAAGAAGGLVGGIIFGLLMQMMGMIEPIGGLVGSETVAVGWAFHVFNSLVIGVLYGLTFGAAAHTYPRGAGYGLIYGAIWWVLGALLIMPLWMGQQPFMINEMALMSLMGHLIYGLGLGLTFAGITQPNEGTAAARHRPQRTA